MDSETRPNAGTALRNSLWNLLFRVVSSTDFSRVAWTTVLRGACTAFFKEPIDELPLHDNDASRLALKERFLALPAPGLYDLFEFLLSDQHAGLKEVDRKLIRRGVNELLEREGAAVRLFRDRFRPYQELLGYDEVAEAEGAVRLFDLAAAGRHLENAIEYLSRRPEPEGGNAVREALFAVAAVVLDAASRSAGPGDPAPSVVVGSVAPAAAAARIPESLARGIEEILRRAHRVSGLPVEGEARKAEPLDPGEAHFLVVFASSLIRYLLRDREPSTKPGQ